MDKEEFLHKYIEEKAEKFAMTRPKAPNIPQKTHDLICELAKESFRHGFLKALESIDEINYMFSKIDMGNEQLN